MSQKCGNCSSSFDNKDRKEKFLPCGHSFCVTCLRSMAQAGSKSCPVCAENWSHIPVKNLKTIYQLPDDKGLESPKVEMEKVHLCEIHGYELEFWCEFDNMMACKKCLVIHHKNCDWVLIEDKLDNLQQECTNCKRHFAGRLDQVHDFFKKNVAKIATVNKMIDEFKEMKVQLEDHQVVILSMESEEVRLLNRMEICEKRATLTSDKGRRLSIFKLILSVRDQVNQLYGYSAPPSNPLEKLVDIYEKETMRSGIKRGRNSFPKTLQGFGYEFKDGHLSTLDNGGGFVFEVRTGDPAYNQEHYEALGEVITEHVYELLESVGGLKRLPVPATLDDVAGAAAAVAVDQDVAGPGFVFASHDWDTCDKLMILIHGSGVVRAGQWARRLIINDSLETGTQLPFIERALSDGYGVLVLNTNQQQVLMPDGTLASVSSSSSPFEHGMTVWRTYVQQAAARHIAIVAHSYGGVVTVRMFRELEEEDFDRVFAIGMTDSVHMLPKSEMHNRFIKMSRNWVTSSLPLDTDLSHSRTDDVRRVSSAVMSHEMTSSASMNSVFRFFEERYQKRIEDEMQVEGAVVLPDPSYRSGHEATAEDIQSSMDRSQSMPTASGGATGLGNNQSDIMLCTITRSTSHGPAQTHPQDLEQITTETKCEDSEQIEEDNKETAHSLRSSDDEISVDSTTGQCDKHNYVNSSEKEKLEQVSSKHSTVSDERQISVEDSTETGNEDTDPVDTHKVHEETLISFDN